MTILFQVVVKVGFFWQCKVESCSWGDLLIVAGVLGLGIRSVVVSFGCSIFGLARGFVV